MDNAALATATLDSLTSDAEMALVRRLAEWPRMVEAAAFAREPHRIAFYLPNWRVIFMRCGTVGVMMRP